MIAATPAEVEQLTSLYTIDPTIITVIPPGVDTCHFYPIPQDEAKEAIGVPQDAQMILFVGRIEPLKGVDTLIRAIAVMREDCQVDLCSYHLAIIGGDPDEGPETTDSEMNRLKALCHELGLEEVVIFLGKRDQNTLPYYYSAAEMLVMPSFYESFGMVALEAMACGTPVIASHTGGLAHLVKNGVNGFTVSGGNVIELSDRLTQLVVKSNLREIIGRQAAEYAKSYSWVNITERIRTVYESVIEGWGLPQSSDN